MCTCVVSEMILIIPLYLCWPFCTLFLRKARTKYRGVHNESNKAEQEKTILYIFSSIVSTCWRGASDKSTSTQWIIFFRVSVQILNFSPVFFPLFALFLFCIMHNRLNERRTIQRLSAPCASCSWCFEIICTLTPWIILHCVLMLCARMVLKLLAHFLPELYITGFLYYCLSDQRLFRKN